MIEVPPPDLKVGDVLEIVGSRMRWLHCVSADMPKILAEAEAEFVAACVVHNYAYVPSHGHTEGQKQEMVRLYEGHLRDGAGRSIYDALLGHCPRGVCAYCQTASATTLDHYREKSSTPWLAITPANLIPACHNCNWGLRLSAVKFNPYFDRISGGRWLRAKLTGVDADSPGVLFEVVPDGSIDSDVAERIVGTFNGIRLGVVFSSRAGSYVARTVTELLAQRDLESAIAHLLEEEVKYAEVDKNAPERAVAEAMINCDWFLADLERRIVVHA